MQELEIKKEFMIAAVRFSDCGNGRNVAHVAQFPPGKCEPEKVFEVYEAKRYPSVKCENCDPDFLNNLNDFKCVHTALYKVWKRQGFIEERIYFWTFDNHLGYFGKGGKLVKLSSVERYS